LLFFQAMALYTHLFFDLDGTLWDIERNTRITLEQIVHHINHEPLTALSDRFIERYHVNNDRLWELYRNQGIEKDKLRWYRFYLTLKDLGIDSMAMARELDRAYIEKSPLQTSLIAHSREVLEYLTGKDYHMYIVTNGFNEVQFRKIRESGLEEFFRGMITSEMAGFLKPHPRFFEYTLSQTGAGRERSLVIGDSLEADIQGAMDAGLHAVYFNRSQNGKVPEGIRVIHTLTELKEFL